MEPNVLLVKLDLTELLMKSIINVIVKMDIMKKLECWLVLNAHFLVLIVQIMEQVMNVQLVFREVSELLHHKFVSAKMDIIKLVQILFVVNVITLVKNAII